MTGGLCSARFAGWRAPLQAFRVAAVAASGLCCILPVVAALWESLVLRRLRRSSDGSVPDVLTLTGLSGWPYAFTGTRRGLVHRERVCNEANGSPELDRSGIVTAAVAGLAAFPYYSGHIIQAVVRIPSTTLRHPPWRVDPDGIRERCGPRWFADEALGVLLEGCGQDALPVVKDIGGEPVVNHVRRQHGDAAVVMFEVVPVEEAPGHGRGRLPASRSGPGTRAGTSAS